MIADLDTLLTALSVELGNRIIPGRGFARRGPDGRPEVTDAELACIAVVQVLLPAGLWARVIQRLFAINVVIWLNWLIGAPVKRSLTPTIISP